MARHLLIAALAVALAMPGCCKKRTSADNADSGTSESDGAGVSVSVTNANITSSSPYADRVRDLEISGILGTGKIALQANVSISMQLAGTPGAKVKIGSKEIALSAAGTGVFDLELLSHLLKHLKTLQLAPGKIAIPKLTLAVELSKGTSTEKGELTVDAQRLAILWTRWGAEKEQPLRLTGEKDGQNQKRSLIFNEILDFSYLGRPGPWEDADLFAIVDYADERKKNCGKYVNRATGESKVLEITLNDKTVAVYDRRTGKRVAQKLFTAKGTCPDSARSGSSDLDFYADSAAVSAFVKSQVKP